MTIEEDKTFKELYRKKAESIGRIAIEFLNEYEKIHDEISYKLRMAAALIDEAAELSEEYGIPFCPPQRIMWCRPAYFPGSFQDKFQDNSEEFIEFVDYITNAGYFNDGDTYTGWQQSQTC